MVLEKGQQEEDENPLLNQEKTLKTTVVMGRWLVAQHRSEKQDPNL